MGLLDILSNLSQGFSEMTSKDEMVFGEIVRIFDKRGCPCIEFQAQSGYQSGRFLLNGDVLFSVTVVLDKKVAGRGIMKLTGEVRNKLADPDDMIEMFKTDLMNIAKFGFGGQIKINHEYNSIYAHTTLFENISSYVNNRVVDTSRLESHLDDYIAKVEDALRKYKKD